MPPDAESLVVAPSDAGYRDSTIGERRERSRGAQRNEPHRRRAGRGRRRATQRPDRSEYRRGVRQRAAVGRARRRPGLRRGGPGVRDLARHHPGRAAAGAAEAGRRDGGSCRGDHRRRVREHRQAGRADPQRGAPTRGRPDPLLRRRRPGAGGPQCRRVHGRADLVCPAGADRGRRAGHAVELPDDDGRLEVRARAGGGQLCRPQAQRHHAGQHRPDGRDRRRVLPAGRVQRRLR